MEFVDREPELERLDELVRSREGGLAVVYGRRRIGKTRLLVEWTRKHGGVYSVADQSSPDIQRRYLAEAFAGHFRGFADVEYRDWRGLLARLAREARASGWVGPLVIDELPYLVLTSPELPSVLQAWIDGDALASRLVTAVAGSSQRMMQGLVLDGNAPLYGRARVVLALGPLGAEHLPRMLGAASPGEIIEAYAAWGGVPRYLELARETRGTTPERIDRLVLDPRGPLHREPDRLLVEETPPAIDLRPILDAIGAGAHRLSEIAARIGRPATSLGRPIERLIGMGLVRREVPFGEPERRGKRSLYRIADPFVAMWFRVVAANRGFLESAPVEQRLELLGRHWKHLVAVAWEDLCRARLPDASPPPGGAVAWGPASRWWRGAAEEWDVVASSADGKRLLLGEARWSRAPVTPRGVQEMALEVARRAAPSLSGQDPQTKVVRALFVPQTARPVAGTIDGVFVVTGQDLLGPPR